MVLQCINGVSSNPVEGRTKIWQLKDLILTLFGLIFRRIYDVKHQSINQSINHIYIYRRKKYKCFCWHSWEKKIGYMYMYVGLGSQTFFLNLNLHVIDVCYTEWEFDFNSACPKNGNTNFRMGTKKFGVKVGVMVFNTTFNNNISVMSCRSVLLVEETTCRKSQTNFIYHIKWIHLAISGIPSSHNISDDRHWLHRYGVNIYFHTITTMTTPTNFGALWVCKYGCSKLL